MQQNELHRLLLHFKDVFATGIVLPTSSAFYLLINPHGWKATSISTLVNVQLQKMILKKIYSSWWATGSLVSFLSLSLFFCFMFLCVDFVHLFIHCKWNNWKFEESMRSGLSDIRRKAEETHSSMLLQTI